MIRSRSELSYLVLPLESQGWLYSANDRKDSVLGGDIKCVDPRIDEA
jgi:hypothetical protein